MTKNDLPQLNGRFLSAFEGDAPARSAPPRRGLVLQAAGPAPLPELILGESSLLPFHFLRTGDRLGRAVVKIRRGDGASGTGFLVAPDILLTNHHVLPDPSTASAAIAVANHEAAPPSGGACARTIEVRLAPDRLFVTQDELDFTFCGVLGLEGLGTIPLDRDSRDIGPTDVVNIIQHPRGRPKEVALQDNQVVKADPVVLHYVCDTEPGSSGSPVFDNDWRLVALHHASILADGTGQGRRARGLDPNVRFLNEGVRLSAIALWLDAAEAATPAGRDVERLRTLFLNVDPSAGFFGGLGRSTRGRSAVELVSGVASRGEILDVGFWDLQALAPRLLDHLETLGPTMAGMGMDVWCLAHISPTEARLLAEYLDTHFRVEFRNLPEHPTLAVLARRSRLISADRIALGGFDAVRVEVRDLDRSQSTVHLMPMPDRGPSSVLDRASAIRAAGDADDWLLLGGPSAHLSDDDHASLLASGRDVSRAIAGDGGGLVLLRSPRPNVSRLFVTPNLSARGDALRLVSDRPLPDPARFLHLHLQPIAARLVLGGDARA